VPIPRPRAARAHTGVMIQDFLNVNGRFQKSRGSRKVYVRGSRTNLCLQIKGSEDQDPLQLSGDQQDSSRGGGCWNAFVMSDEADLSLEKV
jgi:hypothetical protein